MLLQGVHLKKIYIGPLCLTLLICNVTSSVASQHNPLEHIAAKESNGMLNKEALQQKQITADGQGELLRSLLQSEKTYLAHKEKMTANNMIPDLPIEMKKNLSALTILVGAATSYIGTSYFLGKDTYTVKEFKQHKDGIFGMLTAGLLITTLGLVIGISSPDNRPDDIDHHTQKNIEQLEAGLAALQTKNPSSPEATVETKS